MEVVDSRSGDEPADEIVIGSLTKLVRLRWMLAEMRAELHGTTPDQRAVDRLHQRHRRALIEVGSALSDPLLAELASVAAPPPPDATLDEVRLGEAQLLGWLDGVLGVLAHV